MLLRKLILSLVCISSVQLSFAQTQEDSIRRILIEPTKIPSSIYPIIDPSPPIIWPPGIGGIIDPYNPIIWKDFFVKLGSLCGERFHDNGNISSRCECNADSILHGKSVYWDTRGRITNVYIYRNGKIYVDKRYSEGKLTSIENFNYAKDGTKQLHGLRTEYYENGKKTSMYQNDLEHGLTTEYRDGKKIAQTNFIKGNMEWKKQWFNNGQLSSEIHYDESAREKSHKTWNEEGVLTLSQQSIKGLKEGEWYKYSPGDDRKTFDRFENGNILTTDEYIGAKLKRHIDYSNGRIDHDIAYHLNGTKYYETKLLDDGSIREEQWDQSGKQVAKFRRMDDYLLGKGFYTTYEDQYIEFQAAEVVDEFLPIIHWTKVDGKLVSMDYSKNSVNERNHYTPIEINKYGQNSGGKMVKDGLWKTYNGNYIDFVETYKKGTLNGRAVYYKENGADPYPNLYGSYLNGKKEDVWISVCDSVIEHFTYSKGNRNGKYIKFNRSADTIVTEITGTYPTTATPNPIPQRSINERIDTAIVAYYKNDMLHGEYFEYKNDKVVVQGEYVNGLKHGLWFVYDFRGTLIEEGEYQEGRIKGHWYHWIPNKKGKMKKRKAPVS